MTDGKGAILLLVVAALILGGGKKVGTTGAAAKAQPFTFAKSNQPITNKPMMGISGPVMDQTHPASTTIITANPNVAMQSNSMPQVQAQTGYNFQQVSSSGVVSTVPIYFAPRAPAPPALVAAAQNFIASNQADISQVATLGGGILFPTEQRIISGTAGPGLIKQESVKLGLLPNPKAPQKDLNVTGQQQQGNFNG